MRCIPPCVVLAFWSTGAVAQVQRSFVNPSFEQPAVPSANCWTIREAADVPGWETTEPSYTGDWAPTSHGTCGGHPPAPPIEGGMQIFKNDVAGVSARAGIQWAELNAFTPSRLYQNVCMVAGERVDWRLAHKGRIGTERMTFNIGPDPSGAGSQLIIDATTTTAGAGTLNSCGLGTCSLDGTVSGWADYSGNFIWNGASGVQTIGFQAVTGGSAGNYLDDIVLILRPYVEFFPAVASTRESEGPTGVPAIRITGVVETTFDVVVAITGGTAELGTDFTAPGTTFSVTIPAGDHGAGQDFPLPLSAIDNSAIEGDRTVTFAILGDSTDYVVSSTTVCGGPANAELTWVIVDDDVDLSITKDDGKDTYIPGTDNVYTIVVTNLGPFAVAGARITDPLPAGIATASWTCDGGGGGGVCGAASGTGAIDTTADLPAGASVTYLLTMPVPDGYSGDLTNTATVAAPEGFTDVDPGNNEAADTNVRADEPPVIPPGVYACNIASNGSFESPDIQNDPEGPGDNTAYVNGAAIWRTTTNPISGWQTVSGTIDILRHYNNASDGLQSIDLWGTAAATIRQTFTGLVPGGQYTLSVDYSGLSSTDSVAVVQLANGAGAAPATLATLRPAADGVSNGNAGIPNVPAWTLTWSTFTHTFTATGTEATVQFINNAAPATSNTGLFIDNFVFAGDPCADLGIVKTVTPEEALSGDPVTYTLEVSNDGPDHADGAVVTDPGVPDNLECTALACSAAGGAVCPDGETPAQLAAGLEIPTFPNGGTVTLALTCTVTATGQ